MKFRLFCIVVLSLSTHVIFTDEKEQDPAKIGVFHYDRGHYKDALAAFQAAKEQDPQNPMHYMRIAKAYAQLDNFEGALQILKEAPEIDAEHQKALYLDYLWLMGNTYRYLHAFDQATECFQSLVANAALDDYRQAWLAGNALSGLADHEKAIELWQASLALLPESEPEQSYATLHRNIGHTAIVIKSYPLAIEHLKQSISHNPHIASTYDSLGTAYRKNKQLLLAMQCYAKALEVDPEWLNAISNMGICLSKEGKTQEAMQQFNQALSINERHFEAHYHLGKILLAQNEKNRALEHLKQAKEINDQGSIVSVDKVEKYLKLAQRSAA